MNWPPAAMSVVIFVGDILTMLALEHGRFCYEYGVVMDKITKPVIVMMVLGFAIIATLMTFGASDLSEQAKSNRAAMQAEPEEKESANTDEPANSQPSVEENAGEAPAAEFDLSEFGEPIVDTTPLVGDFANQDTAEEIREGADEPAAEASDAADQAAEAAAESSSDAATGLDQ